MRDQIDLLRVDVDAPDVVTPVREARCGHGPDVSEPEHRDLHRCVPLTMVHHLACSP